MYYYIEIFRLFRNIYLNKHNKIVLKLKKSYLAYALAEEKGPHSIIYIYDPVNLILLYFVILFHLTSGI